MGSDIQNATEQPKAPLRWLDCAATAKRVGRAEGRIRKLCPTLQVRGLARKRRDRRTGQVHWEIRSDFQIERESPELVCPVYAGTPIIISAGDLLLTIEATGAARVVIDTIGQDSST